MLNCVKCEDWVSFNKSTGPIHFFALPTTIVTLSGLATLEQHSQNWVHGGQMDTQTVLSTTGWE